MTMTLQSQARTQAGIQTQPQAQIGARISARGGLIVAGLAWALFGGAAALADTVTLSPSKDNTLYDGSVANTSNGAGTGMFVGQTNFDGERRGLIAFDLSSIPAGSTISAATLTLTTDRGAGASITIDLHRLTSNWGEGSSAVIGPGGQGAPASVGDATWSASFYPGTLWGAPGGDFVAISSASAVLTALGSTSWASAGLVADVQAWVDAPASNFGWILKGSPDTFPSTTRRFLTRENPTNGPSLSVTFTPPETCPCSADFDGSGGTPDAGDIDAFFSAWLSGEASADADCSGGTPDAGDIDVFFTQWLAGGC
jgi:hypothetical protein